MASTSSTPSHTVLAPPSTTSESSPGVKSGASSGGLQYTYHPPPKAPVSLEKKTRTALSSLLPHPSQKTLGTSHPSPPETEMSGQEATSKKHSDSDPVDATGTSGSGAHTLDSQVGGHAGVLSSDDGALIIKPTLPLEKEFYDNLAASAPLLFSEEEEETEKPPALSPFEPLRPWIPKYYGTLRLEGRARSVGEGGETVIEDVPEIKNKESLVLENVSHPFVRPNVLDVKLGTVLHEANASEEKKKRMEETARNTTSLETGVRLTGFQVWNAAKNSYDVTDKSYGKSIKAADLPAGTAKFFSAVDADKETGPGVRKDLLIPVVKGVLDQLQEVRQAVASTEFRMVGGSILVVWEGDEAALEAALDKKFDTELAIDSDLVSPASEVEESGVTSGVSSEYGVGRRVGPPYIVRIIDFAHTHAVPGLGPDEGVLKGVDTTVSLLRGRLAELGDHQ